MRPASLHGRGGEHIIPGRRAAPAGDWPGKGDIVAGMSAKNAIPRRDVLTAAATAFTTSLFTGKVKGANDRVAVGFIGLGAMGSGNLGYSMKVSGFVPAAICDVYQPHLE